MDNLNQPAFPVSITIDDKMNRLIDSTETGSAGFTKLEYAALMIAQGILSCSNPTTINGESFETPKMAVLIAKRILEEANKSEHNG